MLQKEEFKKIAEATDDLIGNTIGNKITKASQNYSKENENELEIPKERYKFQNKDSKLLMN